MSLLDDLKKQEKEFCNALDSSISGRVRCGMWGIR